MIGSNGESPLDPPEKNTRNGANFSLSENLRENLEENYRRLHSRLMQQPGKLSSYNYSLYIKRVKLTGLMPLTAVEC